LEFLGSFLTVAEKVGLLFILIAIGFFCQRKKMLTEESNKSLADIVMYIVSPCVIINAFSANMYSKEELTVVLKNIALVAGISVLAHVLMIVAVTFIFRTPDENRRRLMRFSAVFSNAGFIALPLAQALIDTPTFHEGALYASAYLAMFNVTLWTWGLVDMSGNKKDMRLRKILLNPGVVSVVIGMIIFTSPLYLPFGEGAGIRLPGIIADALATIAALNLPLPMLMVGYYLGKADLRAAFRDTSSFFCMALRLLIFPLLVLLLLWLCGVKGNVLLVSVIGASAPVGATATIFSAKFSRDTDLSVRLVSLSTILSLITMPIIVGLTRMIA